MPTVAGEFGHDHHVRFIFKRSAKERDAYWGHCVSSDSRLIISDTVDIVAFVASTGMGSLLCSHVVDNRVHRITLFSSCAMCVLASRPLNDPETHLR